MGRTNFDDRQMDKLLSDSLASDEQPGALAVMALKRQLQQKRAEEQGPSLWWLPALSGTAVSACFVYALSFVAVDWKCMTAVLVAAGAFVLSAWLLTIFGIFKFESFKEAFKI